jgi:ABC-type bacteriocin/lantibiotic exporter with double-glycine peptidase domain
VGTGKTTLLDGLLGEVKRSQGQVNFGGTCGYGMALSRLESDVCVYAADWPVPQEAWVQSGSVRSNITFAAPFAADESRLANVVRASALDEDLRSMAEGVE